jgi:hypothetical protein
MVLHNVRWCIHNNIVSLVAETLETNETCRVLEQQVPNAITQERAIVLLAQQRQKNSDAQGDQLPDFAAGNQWLLLKQSGRGEISTEVSVPLLEKLVGSLAAGLLCFQRKGGRWKRNGI